MSNTGDPRGGRVWARTVSYIKNRDPQCKLAYPGICTGKSETADHIIPVEKGGSERPNNLQGACKACNWHRGNKDLPDGSKAVSVAPAVSTGLRIVFDGAEKGSHRVLLESMGVSNFAMSFWRLRQRGLPKTKPYLIENYFEPQAEVYVDSGWMQAQEKLSGDDLLAYAAEYSEFLNNNAERLAGATEMHLTSLGMDWIRDWRSTVTLPEGVLWPVWIPEHGQPNLMALAEQFENVALPNKAIEDPVIPPRLRALQGQFQTGFHALACANPDTLRTLPLETSSTISWASPQMRGETIVWDGTRLVRYQASRKEQARARYKAVVENAGLDYQKILDDDATEATKLAIWSYQQLEKSMSGKNPPPNNRPFYVSVDDEDEPNTVTERANEVKEGNAEIGGGTVAQREPQGLNSMLTKAAPREASEMRSLPGFGVEVRTDVEMVDGHPTYVERTHLSSSKTSLRQCNTCVVSGNCPAFKPDSACAFNLPVEVKTKEQLRALLNAIMEIQGQRVAFARYAEELNGGYPDPNLSQEIDRLFKLVKTVKQLEQNNDFVRVSVERQTSGGVLSQIFGERAGALTQLDNPVQSDTVIKQILGPES